MVDVQEQILAQLKRCDSPPIGSKNDLTLLEDLMDTVDVKALLKISDSTMYRIKRSKLIQSVRIGRRDYYSMAEIKLIANYFMK